MKLKNRILRKKGKYIKILGETIGNKRIEKYGKKLHFRSIKNEGLVLTKRYASDLFKIVIKEGIEHGSTNKNKKNKL